MRGVRDIVAIAEMMRFIDEYNGATTYDSIKKEVYDISGKIIYKYSKTKQTKTE